NTNVGSISNLGSATVTVQAFVDTANTQYGAPTGTTLVGGTTASPLVLEASAVGTGVMTASGSVSVFSSNIAFVKGAGNYSITQAQTVQGLTLNQTISFDVQTNVVGTPAPASLALLVSGLPALAAGGWLRRRMVVA